jgi:hypothetical protein
MSRHLADVPNCTMGIPQKHILHTLAKRSGIRCISTPNRTRCIEDLGWELVLAWLY